ncbi:hypothetical protein HRbin25_00811 [bacterium HR25]|jgi:hypothetical protein|nr:hypothetical protein HRbin25_00811 [bacterium HR25]
MLPALRLHPWAAAYEGLLDDEEESDEEAQPADAAVELMTDQWRPLQPEAAAVVEEVFFVDGVRRVDAGVVGEEEGRLVWGLFGSYGAGGVRCRAGRAEVAEEKIGRCLVLGSHRFSGEVRIETNGGALVYRLLSIADGNHQKVRDALQQRMRQEEGALVVNHCQEREDVLVVIDGPITFIPRFVMGKAPVVGHVKSHHRRYLEWELMAQVMALPWGSRSPLFLIHKERELDERYSWYVRIAQPAAPQHPLVGIVRMETWASIGLEAARRLADLATAIVPRFASAAGWDARAPANLYPVAALEQRLRHGLGEHQWVRRHIEVYLYRQGQQR